MVFCQRLIRGYALQRPLHICRRKRVAVMPCDIVAQLELPCRVIDRFVTLGQHTHPRVILIGTLHQAMAEIAQHRASNAVIVILHVEGGDIAALGNRQHLAAIILRRRRSSGRGTAGRLRRAWGAASCQRHRQHCRSQHSGCKFSFHRSSSSLSYRGTSPNN